MVSYGPRLDLLATAVPISYQRAHTVVVIGQVIMPTQGQTKQGTTESTSVPQNNLPQ